MRVLEADLDRVRLSVRRPSMAGAWLVLAAILVLLLVPLAGWGAVISQLLRLRQAADTAPPEPLACTWETLDSDPFCARLEPSLLRLPSLAEVYLARRGVHRAQLLPTAFEASPPVVSPLHAPFASLVTNDYERRLVGQVLRDVGGSNPAHPEGRGSAAWLGRDPILGVPLGGPLPDDATVMERIRAHQPGLPPLVDRRNTPLDALEEADVVRTIEDGSRRVTGGPERAHLADRAIHDVRYFDALRTEAVAQAVARHHRDDHEAWATEQVEIEAEAALWRDRRQAALPGVIGAWGLAGVLVVPLLMQRRRTLLVTLDRHALTLDDRRILWESIEELIWTPQSVVFRLEGGIEGEIGELSLSTQEIRMLDRTSQAMWLTPRDAPSQASEDAIRQLLDDAGPRGPA